MLGNQVPPEDEEERYDSIVGMGLSVEETFRLFKEQKEMFGLACTVALLRELLKQNGHIYYCRIRDQYLPVVTGIGILKRLDTSIDELVTFIRESVVRDIAEYLYMMREGSLPYQHSASHQDDDLNVTDIVDYIRNQVANETTSWQEIGVTDEELDVFLGEAILSDTSAVAQ
jgi:hypothetical protein